MTSNKQEHIKWNWQLSSDPEQLWRYVADTNRLFKDLGLPSVQPTDISYHVKEGHRQLSYNSIKYSDAWIEEPYEWEYPYRLGVRRSYKNGPYKEIKLQIDLFPNEKGTRLQYQLWTVAAHPLTSALSTLKHKIIFRSRLKQTLRLYDELILDNRLPGELQSRKRLARGGIERLTAIRQSLSDTIQQKHLVGRLTDYIQRADDVDLTHIKPYELADHWKEDRKEVLHVFLHAVKEGLLNFNWDLYCPSCRTIQQTCKTLNEVHEPVFCSECSGNFDIDFNRSIQLSFRPNPLIRKISDVKYCLGGPGNKTHIAIQQYVKAGQKRYLKTKLPKGTYRLWTPKSKGRATVIVGREGKDTINIHLSSAGLNGEQVEICRDPNLIFENATQQDQLFILEKESWSGAGVTAAQVTSRQVFRDLFGHEVLRKGERIAVNNLTLMFTDLIDSAAMYHKEGDNRAVRRVIEHFEILQRTVAREDGAIVKTIGDSIMAVFSDPAQAFRAFLTAQKELAQNKNFGGSLKLKAGIHHGKCVAVNLNNRIDYFGSTINIASRLADLANENEVIISESVSNDRWMHQLLKSNIPHFSVEQQNASLKGFDTEIFNLKRIRLGNSPLRRAI